MAFDISSGKISGNRVCLLEEIVWFINQMVAIKFYTCHSHTHTPVCKRSQRFFFSSRAFGKCACHAIQLNSCFSTSFCIFFFPEWIWKKGLKGKETDWMHFHSLKHWASDVVNWRIHWMKFKDHASICMHCILF